ncbi:MAG: PIN domain-containing protein [Treponema sp.]|uniref:type II toxin-antitoxin system VapC family toxin n=1 Tax=Treponema sp. TaxID=166 RepID=UPI00298E695E|nr:PIN domain-containing protein [Treponema sp.]MDD5811361.1 PIN domain-containing protein [Treponema sp.]
MEVLIDTNIILDWFLKRDQFYENSKAVLNKCWFGNIKSFITIHSLCDIYYLVGNKFPLEEKKKLIQFLLNRSEIIEENYNSVKAFIDYDFYDDLEDCLQIQSAQNLRLNYIITRNIKDFRYSTAQAVTPEQFLEMIN